MLTVPVYGTIFRPRKIRRLFHLRPMMNHPSHHHFRRPIPQNRRYRYLLPIDRCSNLTTRRSPDQSRLQCRIHCLRERRLENWQDRSHSSWTLAPCRSEGIDLRRTRPQRLLLQSPDRRGWNARVHRPHKAADSLRTQRRKVRNLDQDKASGRYHDSDGEPASEIPEKPVRRPTKPRATTAKLNPEARGANERRTCCDFAP
jgi:hypothetical protein